ncbi:MAG TPA: hypothetical protein VL359_18690, partial [bacterium]|nr:hypothetical protein [bacterium]
MQLNRLTTRLQFIHRYGSAFSLAFLAAGLGLYGDLVLRPALAPLLAQHLPLLQAVGAGPRGWNLLVLGTPLEQAWQGAWPYLVTMLWLGLFSLAGGYGLTAGLLLWRAAPTVTRG